MENKEGRNKNKDITRNVYGTGGRLKWSTNMKHKKNEHIKMGKFQEEGSY
jgi:hypothetical protein